MKKNEVEVDIGHDGKGDEDPGDVPVEEELLHLRPGGSSQADHDACHGWTDLEEA